MTIQVAVLDQLIENIMVDLLPFNDMDPKRAREAAIKEITAALTAYVRAYQQGPREG